MINSNQITNLVCTLSAMRKTSYRLDCKPTSRRLCEYCGSTVQRGLTCYCAISLNVDGLLAVQQDDLFFPFLLHLVVVEFWSNQKCGWWSRGLETVNTQDEALMATEWNPALTNTKHGKLGNQQLFCLQLFNPPKVLVCPEPIQLEIGD